MREVNAVGVVVECRGKILLLKRHENDSEPGKWCLPGGSAEENESLLDAAKRELKEETGLEVFELEELDFHHDIIVYKTSFKDRPVVVLSEEHSEYLWVSYDAALQMDDLIFKNNFDKLILKLKK